MTPVSAHSVASALAESVRTVARAFSPGDQVAPCAVLWPDPEKLWEIVIPDLRGIMPELFVLGPYAPAERSGPALWLRCVEARTVPEAPPARTTPVFYLPGVRREALKDLEAISSSLAPLAETQFRGTVWLHPNGKEWTPLAFLSSDHGGLNLEVARDEATLDALLRALPKLLSERVDTLRGRHLTAEYFNELMAPDASGLLLRWLNDPDGFIKRASGPEWAAFCQQGRSDYRLDPEKDGPLHGAQMLASRDSAWGLVWQRFAEAPMNYPGVVEWLRRAVPKNPSMYDTAEVWPSINDQQEGEVATALTQVNTQPQNEVARRVLELERQHGVRRRYPWRVIGLSPLAVALEPLAKLASLCQQTPGGPTATAFAELYTTQAWQVDEAALSVMAACESLEHAAIVLSALRAMYLPWLEIAARHLQQLLGVSGRPPERRHPVQKPDKGCAVMFADGLRFDVAKLLYNRLTAEGLTVTLDWDWAPVPTVTATAKPVSSPLAAMMQPGEASNEFAPNMATGQRVTQDRFVQALKAAGWQVLNGLDTGDPEGAAWTEAGTLDKHGHHEGWKLARAVAGEVRELAARIQSFLKAGWTEVQVVTDHGWLLVPQGLPKVELKGFLAEHQWGRCAALKPAVTTTLPEFKWHWNETVRIVVPPGVGCFKAGVEYSHGGVSLQEMVVPHLLVRAGGPHPTEAQLANARWTGARCRIEVKGTGPEMSVDVRVRIGDANTSLLVDKQAKVLGDDGTVSVFLDQDADIGKSATIVLLDASRHVIASLPTEVGGNP